MEAWQEIREDAERGARRLVEEHGERLYAAAFLLCRDAVSAEDLVFRALARAVDKIGQYSGGAAFHNWLYAIMLNIWRDDCRKMRAEVTDTGELPEADTDSAWPNLGPRIRDEEARIVRDAVRALPHMFREVVVLRYFEEKSLAEIAETTHVPLGTVKSRLRLAQRRLAAMLTKVLGGMP